MGDTSSLLLVVGGTLGLVVAIAVPAVLWRRSEVSRARRAAMEALGPVGARFGVAVVAGEGDVLPWLQLAPPRGVPVTVCAELVGDTGTLNDEPGAWVRKTLTVLGWTLLGVVLLAITLGGGDLTTNRRSQGSVSGGIRALRLVLPLPAYFGALVIEPKRGFWNRSIGASLPPLGDPAFDAAFTVQGAAELARMVLTPPVRAALLGFREVQGKLAVHGGQAHWSRRTYATDGLDGVLDGLTRLATALGGGR
jgi:hypothetical protein